MKLPTRWSRKKRKIARQKYNKVKLIWTGFDFLYLNNLTKKYTVTGNLLDERKI